jgi:hypothetical protein
MTTDSGSVRHGLYIPKDLLLRIKEIAQRERTSINKKIENIIKEWFDLKSSHDITSLTREEFHRLPSWRKKQILAEQAKSALPFYSSSNEWADFPVDDIHDD